MHRAKEKPKKSQRGEESTVKRSRCCCSSSTHKQVASEPLFINFSSFLCLSVLFNWKEAKRKKPFGRDRIAMQTFHLFDSVHAIATEQSLCDLPFACRLFVAYLAAFFLLISFTFLYLNRDKVIVCVSFYCLLPCCPRTGDNFILELRGGGQWRRRCWLMLWQIGQLW